MPGVDRRMATGSVPQLVSVLTARTCPSGLCTAKSPTRRATTRLRLARSWSSPATARGPRKARTATPAHGG
eukprot:3505652-Prymnesium_polylepis.1